MKNRTREHFLALPALPPNAAIAGILQGAWAMLHFVSVVPLHQTFVFPISRRAIALVFRPCVARILPRGSVSKRAGRPFPLWSATFGHASYRAQCLVALLAAFVAMSMPAAQAQQGKAPRAGYAFPAGGKCGTSVEVTVGGQFLEGTKDVLLSGSGVKAGVLRYRKPLPQNRFNEFNDYIQQEKKKRAEAKAAAALDASATPPRAPKHQIDSPEAVSELLKETGATDDEIANFLQMRQERRDSKRQQNQQLSETVTLHVEIDANAVAGPRSLRLVTPGGVSNPIVFCVGNLPERLQPESKKRGWTPAIKLPAVLNGQILPGQIDRYSFELQRGQRFVVVVQARDLTPYLADAVPGWFQPAVSLFNPKHQEVASPGIFRTGPDPVFSFEVGETGTYDLEIHDALYRGREDFVYRISAGSIPFVTGIFPLGGRVGSTSAVDAAGWNLPRVRGIPVPTTERGAHPVPGLSNGLATGDVAFAVDDLPEILAKETDKIPAGGRPVTLPVIINGRLHAPGVGEVFSFHCAADEKIVAEVQARRLNSPLDSWLKITDSQGHQLAFNDDFEDKESGLLTHQADSRIEFTVPKAGTYFLHLGDTRGMGGAEYAYRLRISAPRPDFALRIVPSAVNGRPGAAVPVTLYALRRDGFNGDIDVALKDPPEGFLLQGGRIPGGVDQIRATLTLPPSPTDAPVDLALEGRATIDEKEEVRSVVPAEDMLQAFIYHQLVPASEFLASVSGNPNVPVLVSGPVRIPAGGSGQVVLSRRGRPPFTIEETRLQLIDPPKGIAIEGISRADAGAAISLRCDATVKPGTRGNLLIEAFGEKIIPEKDGKKAEKKRWSMGCLPAIAFEVAEP